MRGFSAALVILLGALLTFPSAIALWEQRVLTNREAFIALGQDVLREEAVQDRLTERVTEEIEEVAAANGIVLSRGGAAGSLAFSQAEALTAVVVSGLADSPLGEQVLVLTHEAVLTAIDNDRDVLGASEDQIVINLRPAIDEVLTGFTPLIPALNDIEVPEGAGEMVIVQEEDAALAFQAVRWFDGVAWYIALLPLGCLAIALLIGPNRPLVLLLGGGALIATAAVRILFYDVLLRDAVVDAVAENRADLRPAAAAIYDSVAAGLVAQEMLLIAIGVFCIAGGAVWWGLRRTGGF